MVKLNMGSFLRMRWIIVVVRKHEEEGGRESTLDEQKGKTDGRSEGRGTNS